MCDGGTRGTARLFQARLFGEIIGPTTPFSADVGRAALIPVPDVPSFGGPTARSAGLAAERAAANRLQLGLGLRFVDELAAALAISHRPIAISGFCSGGPDDCRQRLNHRRASARPTRPARSALRSTYRTNWKKCSASQQETTCTAAGTQARDRSSRGATANVARAWCSGAPVTLFHPVARSAGHAGASSPVSRRRASR